MKKLSILFAAAAAALSLASCNKEQLPAEQPSAPEIKINITVGNLDGTPDTKAVKNSWVPGDKINIWYDSNRQQNPDLVIVYNGSTWTVDATATVSGNMPSARGFIKAVYISGQTLSDFNFHGVDGYGYFTKPLNDMGNSGMKCYEGIPLTVCTNYGLTYTFESDTLTANLDSWIFSNTNNCQVVISGLSEGNWAMYCNELKIRNGFTLYYSWFDYPEPRSSYVGPVENEDGFAFNFAYSGYSASDFNFTLYNIDTDEKYFYTAKNKTLDGTGDKLNAIKIPFSKFAKPADPFTITSTGSTSVAIAQIGTPGSISLEYRTNKGSWLSYAIGTSVDLSDGDALQFRASSSNSSFSTTNTNNRYSVSTTGDGTITVSGNIMSLLDNSGKKTTLDGATFTGLFMNNLNLTDASELILPADELSSYAYNRMFTGCSNLTAAPKLPATKMGTYCYQYMFSSCSSLTAAPELPATDLANYCYDHMFNNCSLLEAAPDLPATTLANYCYNYMFNNCTSLRRAPEVLPAEVLAVNSYSYMFFGCRSLTTAPILPAISAGYSNMFNGCSSLNYVKAMFVPTSYGPQGGLTNWLKDVSPTGTFVYNKDANLYTLRDYCGIPEGWTWVPAEE